MFNKICQSFLFSIPILLLFAACNQPLPEEVAMEMENLPEEIDFNFHVRPILSDRCWACHGPDANSRKAELRLDTEEGAFAALTEGSGHAFVKGKPAKSVALQRMISTDPETVMPPPESKLDISAKEIAIISKWIEQGATWKKHWAYIPPQKQTIPEENNPIDHFVLAKLKEQDLSPAPRAEKERLLRRLYLDLTGLPPSIEAINAFMADDRPDAYEKVVDQLLDSDAYAERMAMEWMDVARYADSHGMHADGWRMMWPWRDWVIQSFKKNKPYNEFVTEQLAGDLLPKPDKNQILATAFNRNHPMTAEGGAIDEEFRLSYVFDRAETATTAFLGLTLNCARCHDHKFDPISQEEYYQMAAFFNNVKELGMTGDDGNYGPMMLITTEAQNEKLQALSESIQEKEGNLKLTKNELSSTKTFINNLKPIQLPIKYMAHISVENLIPTGKKNNGYHIDGNKKMYAAQGVSLVEGKIGKGLQLDDEYDEVYLNDVGLFELTEPFSAALWFNIEDRKSGKTQVFMGTAGDKNNFWRGWDFFIDTTDHLTVRLIHSLPHNYIQITTEQLIQHNEWVHAAFSYDGSGRAEGLQLFVNGQLAETSINYNKLYKSIYPVQVAVHTPQDRPILVGKSYRNYTGEKGIIKGKLDEIYLFNRAITKPEVALLFDPTANQSEQNDLVEYHLSQHPKIKALNAELQQLRKEKLEFVNPIPEVMVMEEMPTQRPMHVLNRGQYDQPRQAVDMGTLQQVLPFPDDLPKNRLGFAKWLFLKDNPLTARVTVNRYWQLFFGKGLVNTPQDFGSQGALPTHPDLLDWLAVEFMESNWDLKALHKLIVLSSTYQQSSSTDVASREKDPLNEWLSRGPSHRLPAEIIRDNALAASGLLVQQVGGESVRPYQPEGLWIDKGNFSHMLLRYKITRGDSLYRRSLYTFVKRTSPHPSMTAFDAPNRDVCTVQRESTTTPLQALVLLNDPQFVEAAKVLAQRMQLEGGEDLADQIAYAFRLSTGRKPQIEEINILKALYEQKYAEFKQAPEKAKELLAVGDFDLSPNLDQTQTAALTLLSSTMLNHDEAYTKR